MRIKTSFIRNTYVADNLKEAAEEDKLEDLEKFNDFLWSFSNKLNKYKHMYGDYNSTYSRIMLNSVPI
jgi:hypothetical protein